MSFPRLTAGKEISVNITSSMDISPDESYFSLVTRQISETSSMYDYQLEKYTLSDLKLQKMVRIYSSYSEQKHPCKVLADSKTIVVVTKYHVMFYNEKLELQHQELHNLIDYYDINGSPDSKLVSVVGDGKVLLWDAATFKQISFPYPISTARAAQFSPDNRYIGVSSTTMVTMFMIAPLGDTYEFHLVPQFKAEDSDSANGFGSVTSFDFNPFNPMEIVIGFGNASPRIYNFEQGSGFIRVASNEQPTFMNNFKIVKFMPDGKRVFSSDYLEGIGLWPGLPNLPLLYKENSLFYGPEPYAGGTKVLGYVWQRVKVLEITYPCSTTPVTYESICKCDSLRYFDYQSQTCKQCQTQSCTCPSNQLFERTLSKCVLNCKSIAHTISIYGDPNIENSCYCERGYIWKNGTCTFDCGSIMFALGQGQSAEECLCQVGFEWNSKGKYCSCGQFSQLARVNDQISCNCLPNYSFDSSSRICSPVCSQIPHALNSTGPNNTCLCQENFKFVLFENIDLISNVNNLDSSILANTTILSGLYGGCVRDCEKLNYTQDLIGLDKCACEENLAWDGNECLLTCRSIKNAVDIVKTENEQSCTCVALYEWVPQNLECGRICTDVPYVNKTKYSTAISCPCINRFDWSSTTQSCAINCEKVPFSESYNVADNTSCICKQIFNWNAKTMGCEIDCEEVWDAGKRIGEGECECKNNRIWNKTSNLCQVNELASTWSQPWIWAIIGVAGLLLIIVAIVMLRFCWKFSSDKNNKEHQKKLKKNPEQKKRKKVAEEVAPVGSERISLNTE